MADFFLDTENEPAPVLTEPVVEIVPENSDLVEVEDIIAYEEVAQIEDPFDPFSTPSKNQDVLEENFLETAVIVPSTVSDVPELNLVSEDDPPSVTPPMISSSNQLFTLEKIEAEIITQWREEFRNRCEIIETEAEKEAIKWRASAEQTLEGFYSDRNEKLEKTRKMNRENADALKTENSVFEPSAGMNQGERWEQVTQSIDFNSKGSCTKDTTRMRQVLLQLKAGKSD